MRRLRCMVGETLVELGEMIRDLGGFVLPDYESHPAFRSNAEVDKNGHFEMGFAKGGRVGGNGIPATEMGGFIARLMHRERG